MPALFLNPEVGVCRSEEQAIQSISRTLLAYAVLRRHITAWEQEEDTFGRLSLYYKEGRTTSIHELLPKMDSYAASLRDEKKRALPETFHSIQTFLVHEHSFMGSLSPLQGETWG